MAKTRDELKKEFEEAFIGANMETLSSQKGESLWNWIEQAITAAREDERKIVANRIGMTFLINYPIAEGENDQEWYDNLGSEMEKIIKKLSQQKE